MTTHQPNDQAWAAGVEFWTRFWQIQIENSLQFWTIWAQVVPHKTAQQLSAEAEALKAPPVTPATKPAPVLAAPRPVKSADASPAHV